MVTVLYKDNHCLALDKPAGLLSQGDETGEATLVDWAREYLRKRYNKPGNVYVGLVHRLDRPVSGVVLLARTSKAAGRLAEAFRKGKMEKVYWAVVEGKVPLEQGEWVDWLAKDAARNKSASVVAGAPGSREAITAFRVLEIGAGKTLLELRPRTGRSHQLRVQASARGFPIVGDKKYGAVTRLLDARGRPRLALHARELTFDHPTRREAISVSAPVPAGWPELSRPR
ncbi:MAG TPA: RluA family pseudouridine synthase [Isosphaeraceae bacterium]|jgi:23S rRNA pseudouridine1911/1915/1917 synthase|nr:RluA family pseudouridine synthase [Isosphaeraceae bacterium]